MPGKKANYPTCPEEKSTIRDFPRKSCELLEEGTEH